MIVICSVVAGDDDIAAWITRMIHGGMEKVDCLLASWEFVVIAACGDAILVSDVEGYFSLLLVGDD